MTFQEFRSKVHGVKMTKIERDRLYALQRAISIRISWFLYRWLPSVQATHVTLTSFAVMVLAGAIGVSLLSEVSQPAWRTIVGLLLLHVVNYTDMIDGELARAHDNSTQRGLFYDRAVHLVFPSVFYFLIASYFFVVSGLVVVFALAMLAGVVHLLFIQCTEGRLLIGSKIKDGGVRFVDLLAAPAPKPRRRILIVRILDYLTFMIYSWTLFFYVLVVLVGVWRPALALWLCVGHLVVTLVTNVYKVFISYPRDRLFTVDEAASLARGNNGS